MKRIKYNNFFKKILVLVIILTSIGFAVLSRSLNINGITSVRPNTWDIHFENVVLNTKSSSQAIPVIDESRTITSFTATLNVPGDYYEFTVDAVNAGTLDGMLNTVASLNLTAEQKRYLDYEITYEDGEEIRQYQELNAGDYCTYKVKVIFKRDLEEQYLPENDTTASFTFSAEYILANNNRIERRAEKSLYNVLRKAAIEGTYAKEYTGEHQDSIDTSKSTKKIYHWYANNDSNGLKVKDKNNVIFAEHCWQMIRTTDTGGVKIVYNGEVENNKCLNDRGEHEGYNGLIQTNIDNDYWYATSYIYNKNEKKFSLAGDIQQISWNESNISSLINKYTCKSTNSDTSCEQLYVIDSYINNSKAYALLIDTNSSYSQYGKLQFNDTNPSSPSDFDLSLANVGYMHNENKKVNNKMVYNISSNILSTKEITDSYLYANEIQYNTQERKYYLVNPYTINMNNNIQNIEGKYTFFETTNTSVNRVYYITDVNTDNNVSHYFTITDGNNKDYYNVIYTYGSTYTDNHNGTYTIENPNYVNIYNYAKNYQNMENNYVCKNATNNTCEDLWYITAAYGEVLTYEKIANNYIWSNGFTYDGQNYILNKNPVNIWNFKPVSSNITQEKILNAHYTCFNTTGICSTLYYIFGENIAYGGRPHVIYVELTRGKSINDFLNDMLQNDEINKNDSIMKKGLELWYEKKLINYSDFIEETVFCNDRKINNLETNGWNPNGGKLYVNMAFNSRIINPYFNQSTPASIKCPNETDKFSTSNKKAKIKYNVGLLTSPEINLLQNSEIKKTGEYYWTMTPTLYKIYYAELNMVRGDNGYLVDAYQPKSILGVRPTISLRKGISYTTGDGSMEHPYIVDTE